MWPTIGAVVDLCLQFYRATGLDRIPSSQFPFHLEANDEIYDTIIHTEPLPCFSLYNSQFTNNYVL